MPSGDVEESDDGQRPALGARNAEALPAATDQEEQPAPAHQETDRPEHPRVELAERQLHRWPVAAPEKGQGDEEKNAAQRPGSRSSFWTFPAARRDESRVVQKSKSDPGGPP